MTSSPLHCGLDELLLHVSLDLDRTGLVAIDGDREESLVNVILQRALPGPHAALTLDWRAFSIRCGLPTEEHRAAARTVRARGGMDAAARRARSHTQQQVLHYWNAVATSSDDPYRMMIMGCVEGLI